MRATANNTRGACQRCGRETSFVMAVAFQGDGTGEFRHLCASCERMEKHRNEPHLFIGIEWVYIGEPEPEPDDDEVYSWTHRQEREIESPQMSLFA